VNTTPDFETPAYRSVVRLLNLYCLFKMGLFLWHAVPFFAQMFASVEFNPVLFISSFYMLFVTPALILCLLCLSLSRTKEARIARPALLSLWLLLRLVFLPNVFRTPNIDRSTIALNLLDLLCLGLFLYLLTRRRKTPAPDDV
jgi:hypothetical protein